jgi:hypothetical protein
MSSVTVESQLTKLRGQFWGSSARLEPDISVACKDCQIKHQCKESTGTFFWNPGLDIGSWKKQDPKFMSLAAIQSSRTLRLAQHELEANVPWH